MSNKIKLAIDVNVHGAKLLGQIGWLDLQIIESIEDVVSADALIVSSAFKVIASELTTRKINWVGSATSGYDHVDSSGLARNQIALRVARGCNANAVREYLTAVIAAYCYEHNIHSRTLRLGIIGFGKVGTLIHHKLQQFLGSIQWCDPVYQTERKDYEAALQACLLCDVLSFNCSLVRTSDNKMAKPTVDMLSHHLIDQTNARLIVNAARGEIMQKDAVSRARKKPSFAIDTHRNERQVTLSQGQYWLATPHIAGQTWQARVNSLSCLLHDLFRWGQNIRLLKANDIAISNVTTFLKKNLIPQVEHIANDHHQNMLDIKQYGLPVHLILNVVKLNQYHAMLVQKNEGFNSLRKSLLRHEFSSYSAYFEQCGMSSLLNDYK